MDEVFKCLPCNQDNSKKMEGSKIHNEMKDQPRIDAYATMDVQAF